MYNVTCVNLEKLTLGKIKSQAWPIIVLRYYSGMILLKIHSMMILINKMVELLDHMISDLLFVL